MNFMNRHWGWVAAVLIVISYLFISYNIHKEPEVSDNVATIDKVDPIKELEIENFNLKRNIRKLETKMSTLETKVSTLERTTSSEVDDLDGLQSQFTESKNDFEKMARCLRIWSTGSGPMMQEDIRHCTPRL